MSVPPTDSFTTIKALVECETDRIEQVINYVYSLGGAINTRLHELITIQIKPANRLEALSRHPGVKSIRLGTPFIAVNYMFTLADSLGKPCVVNLPLGITGPVGSGSNPEERALRYLLEARQGRVICASAGNDNGWYTHISMIPDTIGQGTYLSDNAFECLVHIRDSDREKIALRIALDSAYYTLILNGNKYALEDSYVLPDLLIAKDSTIWLTVDDLIAAGYHWEDTLVFIGPDPWIANESQTSGRIREGKGHPRKLKSTILNSQNVQSTTQYIPICIDLEPSPDGWDIWISHLWLARWASSTNNLFAWGMSVSNAHRLDRAWWK